MTADDNSGGVQVVAFGVADYPAECAAAIFDGGGRQGNGSHAIFDIDDVPAAFEIRKQKRKGAGAVAVDPSAAVNVDERGDGGLGGVVGPKIELEGIVVLYTVNDVRLNGVFVGSDFGPAVGTGVLCLAERRA